MEFTKEHFADVVLPSRSPVAQEQTIEQRKVRMEKQNLELLDHLIPT
jgi:hypothetical protein